MQFNTGLLYMFANIVKDLWDEDPSFDAAERVQEYIEERLEQEEVTDAMEIQLLRALNATITREKDLELQVEIDDALGSGDSGKLRGLNDHKEQLEREYKIREKELIATEVHLQNLADNEPDPSGGYGLKSHE